MLFARIQMAVLYNTGYDTGYVYRTTRTTTRTWYGRA